MLLAKALTIVIFVLGVVNLIRMAVYMVGSDIHDIPGTAGIAAEAGPTNLQSPYLFRPTTKRR